MEGICKPANLQPLSGRRKFYFPVFQQRKEFTLLPTMVCLAYPVVLVDRWGATDNVQPAASIRLASPSSSWRRPVSCPSIPGCCPPISFSVCLFFALLALCPAGLSWQALKILLCARTISVCVFLLWSRRLRGAQWLAKFCFAPLRLRCGLCR